MLPTSVCELECDMPSKYGLAGEGTLCARPSPEATSPAARQLLGSECLHIDYVHLISGTEMGKEGWP